MSDKSEYHCPSCDVKSSFSRTGGFDRQTEENYVAFRCDSCSSEYSPTHGSDEQNLKFVGKNLSMPIGEAMLWVEQLRELMEGISN